jgi:hypothetical protein
MVASAVDDVLSESESTLADGVVLRPGERDRDCDDDANVGDDVVEQRRDAVSAGPWYVRADNAIRMSGGGGGGGVCTGGEVPWNAVWESQTRVVGAAGCWRWVVVGGGGVEGGRVAASIFTLYRRRRVRLYTDNGSGRRGGLLKWP